MRILPVIATSLAIGIGAAGVAPKANAEVIFAGPRAVVVEPARYYYGPRVVYAAPVVVEPYFHHFHPRHGYVRYRWWR